MVLPIIPMPAASNPSSSNNKKNMVRSLLLLLIAAPPAADLLLVETHHQHPVLVLVLQPSSLLDVPVVLAIIKINHEFNHPNSAYQDGPPAANYY